MNRTHSFNILQLASHESLLRGGAVQMIRLARGLALRGHRVTAVFNTADSGEILESEAVRLARAAGVDLMMFSLRGPAGAERLRELWRQGGFDVLHCHRERALLTAADALRRERVACFVAQRGTVYLPDWFSREHRLMLSPRLHGIVTVARAVRRALVIRRLVPPWKVEVVYGGVDTDRFHPGADGAAVRAELGVPAQARVVALPGALVAKKGTEYFIDAAARLRRAHPEWPLRFWLIGSGSSREPLLRGLASRLGLGEELMFIDHRDDMPRVYAASDVVVCASIKGEGLTGTLREALAVGRPVVTTATAGNTELVEDGVTGATARVADAASLAAAIERMLERPGHAAALAAAGRARVLAWCDEAVRSERIEALYRRILTAHGRPRAAG